MSRFPRLTVIAVVVALAIAMTGCGASGAASTSGSSSASSVSSASSASGAASQEAQGASDLGLSKGEYTATFDTDSSMFHVNEADDGKGTLTVTDEGATIHVSLVSKKILNLYPGTADEAAEQGAVLLEPTTDTVTYSDGYQEEVYGFDIPVPVLDEEFDVAILGEKGKWYDHKVSVSDPVPQQ